MDKEFFMQEMEIESIRVSRTTLQRVLVLKEKSSERCLPIWIGGPESDAIQIQLDAAEVPRPLTHDLLVSTILELGAKVHSIVVTDIEQDTFFAKIILERNGETFDLDCRPSDAIALALRSEATIFATQEVMDKASIVLDPSTGQPEKESSSKNKQHLNEEEIEKMSAFSDFIGSLEIDDLGESKEKPSAD